MVLPAHVSASSSVKPNDDSGTKPAFKHDSLRINVDMKDHRILLNTFSLLGIRVGGILLGMATQAVLARGLGVERFGFFTYGFAYLSVFSVAASLGLDTLLIREITRTPQRASFLTGSAMALKAVASVAALLLALTGLALLPTNPVRTLSTGLLTFMIFTNVIQTARSYFDASLRSYRLLGIELLTRSLTLLLVAYVLRAGGELIACILVFLVMEYTSATFVLGMFTKDSRSRPIIDFNTALDLLKKTWPLALQGLLYVVYFRIDMLILEYYRGIKEVGYYSPAYAIMAGLLFVPEALSRSLFPRLTTEVLQNGTPNVDFLLRLVKYFAMVAVPLVIAGSMLAEPIVTFLFGSDFIPAAAPLRFLFWGLGAVFFSYPMSLLLLAQGRQYLTLRFVAVMTVFNIVMNLITIPRWGMMGAALTTVFTEGIGCLTTTVAGLWFSGEANRARINKLWLVRLAQLAAAGTLMAGIIYMSSTLPWLLNGIAGTAGFFLTLLLLGWFTREERTSFIKLLSGLSQNRW